LLKQLRRLAKWDLGKEERQRLLLQAIKELKLEKIMYHWRTIRRPRQRIRDLSTESIIWLGNSRRKVET